ncbi:MAG: gfo/Idh/MocA family oxidoreductase, partial [Gemmataceae bacterium]
TSSKTGADLTDAISCRFTNGATGMIGGAGTMPPKSTYQVDIRIFGTDGMLLLDIERPRLELRRRDGEQQIIDVDQKPGEYSCVEPLLTFVDLIQGKKVENRSTADLGVSVVEVLDAALRSAGSGRSQNVADLD